MSISQSCDPANQLWIFDLRKSNNEIKSDLEFQKVVQNFDAKFSYIANNDNIFVFKTNLNAPRYKLVSIDVNNLEAGFRDVVGEKEDVLQYVSCVNNDKLLLNYLHDCKVSWKLKMSLKLAY